MIASMQAQLPPGFKLMTCPRCKRIGKFPEWQQEVNHVETNYCGLRQLCQPGEIDGPKSAFVHPRRF